MKYQCVLKMKDEKVFIGPQAKKMYFAACEILGNNSRHIVLMLCEVVRVCLCGVI